MDLHEASAIIAICGTLGGLVVVWWKVSKEAALNRTAIANHDRAIVDLQTQKTDNAVTLKLIQSLDKIEKDLIDHHTDFKLHRNEDSERRLDDLIHTVNELARENRTDHQIIMGKLGRVERLDKE